MKKTALLTVLFVYFLLQTLLSDKMALGRVSPDFPLLIVAYLAVYRGAFHGSIAGFIVGFLQDLFNPRWDWEDPRPRRTVRCFFLPCLVRPHWHMILCTFSFSQDFASASSS